MKTGPRTCRLVRVGSTRALGRAERAAVEEVEAEGEEGTSTR